MKVRVHVEHITIDSKNRWARVNKRGKQGDCECSVICFWTWSCDLTGHLKSRYSILHRRIFQNQHTNRCSVLCAKTTDWPAGRQPMRLQWKSPWQPLIGVDSMKSGGRQRRELAKMVEVCPWPGRWERKAGGGGMTPSTCPLSATYSAIKQLVVNNYCWRVRVWVAMRACNCVYVRWWARVLVVYNWIRHRLANFHCLPLTFCDLTALGMQTQETCTGRWIIF